MKALLTIAPHRGRLDTARDSIGRLRLSYEDFIYLAILSDACAIVLVSIAAGGIYHWISFGKLTSLNDSLALGGILAAPTVALLKLKGLYTPDVLLSVRSQIAPIMLSWSSVLLLLFGASFTLKVSSDLSRGWALSFAIGAPLLILCQRSLLCRAMLDVIQKGRLKRPKIILVTSNSESILAADATLRTYDVVGSHLLPQNADDIRSLFRALVSTCRGSDIREIHLAIDWDRWSATKHALIELRELPLPVRLIADATAREILQSPQAKRCGAVSFELQRAPLTPGERATKRAFDLVAATCGLLPLAPFLVAVSLAILIDSSGPVLFRQKRGGFNGRSFTILKFRTMHVMEDDAMIKQATRNDCRVTRIGRWLRRTSFDELPQLINVLLGDMSLVGPRPHALAHDDQYSKLISNYPCRHHVKPGITGWAQVNGFRGETPTLAPMKRRVELDLWYVSNWSLWLDLRILIRTVGDNFRSRNAF
jgi:putative colanic acid biosynthesis UDP-glucose lipid carrier transferase